jgi:sialate O-acetylesterase
MNVVVMMTRRMLGGEGIASWFVAVWLAVASCGTVWSEEVPPLRANGIFADHAVLQRDCPLPVWGTARPGEEITVAFGAEALKSARAGADGRWSVSLDPMPSSTQPRTLTITGGQAERVVVVQDLLVGDVWLCSGQSNMAYVLIQSAREIPAMKELQEKASNPMLRLCTVPFLPASEPMATVNCTWMPAVKDSAAMFSAIGYVYGEQIQRRLNIPIGMICAARGGSLIENWTPREEMEGNPIHDVYMRNWKKDMDEYPARKPEHDRKVAEFDRQFPNAKALETENRARTARGEPTLRRPALRGPDHPDGPARLFNGMVAPIVPYALKGFLWYQGEGNISGFSSYDRQLADLVASWRSRFAIADAPWILSEIAPLGKVLAEPDDSAGARWRESVMKAQRTVSNLHVATIIDAGMRNEIHPPDKLTPANRMIAIALSKVYGLEVVPHGPRFSSWRVEGAAAVVTFEVPGGGLESRQVDRDGLQTPAQPLCGFAVAGADRVFHNAEARITGPDTVEVSSPLVPRPAAVRYGWASFPLVNLYSRAGFPAYSFRTDDWPWNPKK